MEIRNPGSIRPWQHVLEPISGYLLLAEKLYCEPEKFTGAWNFGPDDSDCRTVEWIVKEMLLIWGEGNSWRLQKGVHPHEASYLKIDNTKAKTALGWVPKLSLRESLVQIIDWHKNFVLGDDISEICEQQVNYYASLVMKKN